MNLFEVVPTFPPFLMAFPTAWTWLVALRQELLRLGLDSARGTFLPSHRAAQVPGLYSRLSGSRTASQRHPESSRPGLLQEH